MVLTHFIRVVVLVSAFIGLLCFPRAIQMYARPIRAQILVMSVEFILIGLIGGNLGRFNSPIHWYSTVFILLGTIGLSVYCVRAILETRSK